MAATTARFKTETLPIPTCTENAPGAAAALCTAAVATCPAGQYRFWAFRRVIDTTVVGHNPPWERLREPPSICIGPNDPLIAAIDPAVAIAAVIEREFQRVVVLKGVAEVSPRPDTLVNIPTIFTTDAPASYDIPLTLLGRPVTITATARRWTWHFGDGTSKTTTAAGTRGRVEHIYRRAAPLGPYVVIEWSGTYRIGGGAALPIAGTATTTGDPTALAVKQARTELVDSSR